MIKLYDRFYSLDRIPEIKKIRRVLHLDIADIGTKMKFVLNTIRNALH